MPRGGHRQTVRVKDALPGPHARFPSELATELFSEEEENAIMIIGIPKEIRDQEGRVALTPAAVRTLVDRGHQVYIENNSVLVSRFTNEEYEQVGAQIAFSAEEVYGRADLIAKVSPPTPQEYEHLRDEQILFGFLHLAVAPRHAVEMLLEKQVTAIGYEVIEEDDGTLPILLPMSEIVGQLAIHIAAHYLQSRPDGSPCDPRGGRGILLGGIAGVPSAVVVVLGGGAVGLSAARAALGLGAQVIILDIDPRRLRYLDEILGKRAITAFSNQSNIEKAVKFADVLIGAVLIPGERAPILVTRPMVRSMKPKALIIDLSIDQGGCVETSRPTSLSAPTFVEENVIHYCVPNNPTLVARTATYALSNVSLPYLLTITELGIRRALRSSSSLARGVYTYRGECTKDITARIAQRQTRTIDQLLERES